MCKNTIPLEYKMEQLSRNVMNAIKMSRVELLAIVRENKKAHVISYNEAVGDYKILVLQLANENAKFAATANIAEFKKMKNIPSPPVSYEDSYTRAIRMLELSVEEIIDVSEDIFNQLVLDEWAWKRSFATSNIGYKSAMR